MVLISIERNLAELRESAELTYALALALDDADSFYNSPAERARRIQRYATRLVSLHGWNVYPSQDRYGLVVWRGDFTVTVSFGRQLTDYIQAGPR
jgi:hypothetical protein